MQFLKEDMEQRSALISEFKSDQTDLRMKIEQLHRNLVSAKDEISDLKIQIAIATHDYENR